MKFLALGLFAVYASSASAGYLCNEKDSTLKIEELNERTIKVVHTAKFSTSRFNPVKTFVGKVTNGDSTAYFKTQEYKLIGLSGARDLKISYAPILTRVPTCTGRRLCEGNGSPIRYYISAEFSSLDGRIYYECKKI